MSARKILVVRPDRLGDVILSTPVIEALHSNLPDAELTFMVKDFIAPLVRGLAGVKDVLSADIEPGTKGMLKLARELRSRAFDTAIVLQSRWEIAMATALAGIGTRIGPLSKPHSFVFYNRGIRQRRSRVERHEADYNLQLLSPLGIHVEPRSIPVRVAIDEKVRADAGRWLAARGWRPGSRLVAVHPGMGGSALNWPEKSYSSLIRRLLHEGEKVLITAGPTESELVSRLGEALGGRRETAYLYTGREVRGLDFLAGLFSHASLVIAPSTGPLHLAVALGKKVLSFYPTIRVQSPERWGPYVSDETRASVLVPHVYSEMNSIPVEEAWERTKLLLSGT